MNPDAKAGRASREAEDASLEAPAAAHGKRRRFVTLRYTGASMCGLASDLVVLRLLTGFGVTPAWARVVSLFFAMQVTFCINGFIVFHDIRWSCVHKQWGAYLLMNGLGNFCNYLTFTTLLSLHRAVLSNHVFAVCVGGFVAWVINYSSTRLLVFNPTAHRWLERLKAAGHGPSAPAR